MNNDFYIEYLAGSFANLHVELAIRLLVSLALGLIIGIEREITNKTAGLRTHILVCLGSTVFTILSIHSFSSIDPIDGAVIVNDPARIAAQILTGIGFIGGGAILHYGISVFGLTTAATLWVTASIGMAIGTGDFFVGGFATVLTFIVLVIIRKFENLFLSKTVSKGGRVKVSATCIEENQTEVHSWFFENFKNIQELSLGSVNQENNKVKLTFVIDISGENPVKTIYESLSKVDVTESVVIKQVFV